MTPTRIQNLALTALLTMGLMVPGLTSAAGQDDEQSLYNRLGGLGPISVVVDDFIDDMLPDKLLNQNPAIAAARDRVPGPYLKYRVTSMACDVTGGPCQ